MAGSWSLWFQSLKTKDTVTVATGHLVMQNFYPTLEKQMKHVCRKKQNIMIMGVFNTNPLNSKENRSVAYDKTD